MLKKQTVWLLTMLSLVVVLSVYYIFSPEQTNNLADDTDQEMTDGNSEDSEKDTETNTNITAVTGDEVFETIRMQMNDDRNRKLEQLEIMAGSDELSAEEKSAAKDEMDRIYEIAEKERMLENLIVSTLNYEDALVRADGEEVSITVKGQEPSKSKANEIIQMVEKEMGTKFVTVSFQKEDSDTK